MRENYKLDLYDVFTSQGKKISESLTLDMPKMDIAGISYEISDDSALDVKIENTEQNRAYLTGEGSINLNIPCSRCLTLTPIKLKLSFERELLSSEIRGADDEEYGCIEGNILDIYELIKEEALINMPSKVLCREDCKGLCPVCGANRNETECNCDTFVPDPRFAALGDIFKGSL